MSPRSSRARGGSGRRLVKAGSGLPLCGRGEVVIPPSNQWCSSSRDPLDPHPRYLSAHTARPTAHQDFFVPYDEGNMAGPRRHCGGPRTGGRHLVPIRTGGVFNRKNNPNFRGERGGAIFDSESAIRRRIEPVTQPSGGGARVRPLGRFLSWGVLDWSPLGQGTIHAKGSTLELTKLFIDSITLRFFADASPFFSPPSKEGRG